MTGKFFQETHETINKSLILLKQKLIKHFPILISPGFKLSVKSIQTKVMSFMRWYMSGFNAYAIGVF